MQELESCRSLFLYLCPSQRKPKAKETPTCDWKSARCKAYTGRDRTSSSAVCAGARKMDTHLQCLT